MLKKGFTSKSGKVKGSIGKSIEITLEALEKAKPGGSSEYKFLYSLVGKPVNYQGFDDFYYGGKSKRRKSISGGKKKSKKKRK